jgi:hypothetical protein
MVVILDASRFVLLKKCKNKSGHSLPVLGAVISLWYIPSGIRFCGSKNLSENRTVGNAPKFRRGKLLPIAWRQNCDDDIRRTLNSVFFDDVQTLFKKSSWKIAQ